MRRPQIRSAASLGIVGQHVDEAASLRNMRSHLIKASGLTLRDLNRHDERINAHLDGIFLAGEAGGELSERLLGRLGAGEVFTVSMHALEHSDHSRLQRLLAIAGSVDNARRGLASAFGWASRTALRGVVRELLASNDARRQCLALAACVMHRVDPGIASSRLIENESPTVRARAFRAAGELGVRSMVSICGASTADEDRSCQFWSAWASVILGDRGAGLRTLMELAMKQGPYRQVAYRLSLQAIGVEEAHDMLRSVATVPEERRLLIEGAGCAGDPTYVPWLIGLMDDPETARVAGEAFTNLTGADLARLNLKGSRPENYQSGPTEDPADARVEMDSDDGLAWPDRTRVENWWDGNASRFQTGARYFMGERLNRETCLRVLKEGFQRQRILAARYLCLLEPGTPLFECRAPAFRQQRQLSSMS